MVKKILFATDLGAFMPHALIHLESLSDHFDAEICIVHAVPPMGEFATSVVKSYCSETVKREVLSASRITSVLDAVRDEIQTMLVINPFTDVTISDRVTDIIVTHGNAACVVLKEAERVSADMIVVGSHGTESLDGRMIGSVTAKILQLSKIPVFMIPMMHMVQTHQTLPDFTPSRVSM